MVIFNLTINEPPVSGASAPAIPRGIAVNITIFDCCGIEVNSTVIGPFIVYYLATIRDSADDS